jgi:hypothetical protein
MRVRELDANNDYQFGTSGSKFLINTPLAVAQLVLSRLRLNVGEWFLDLSDGLDLSQIIGYTEDTRDLTIRNRILDTPGVQQIVAYASYLDNKRRFSVICTIDTIYGQTSLLAAL